jgi:hypothetical protein
MSRTIEKTQIILNANAADVAQANGTWHNLEGCDQILFDIQFVGNGTVSLDFDLHNNNAATSQSNYTANAQVVLDDPMGQVRAWSNGIAANESAVVNMRRIFWNVR